MLTSLHDDPTGGHLGFQKTYEKVRIRCHWLGMYKDIEHWCRSCTDCATHKTPRNRPNAPFLPIALLIEWPLIVIDMSLFSPII